MNCRICTIAPFSLAAVGAVLLALGTAPAMPQGAAAPAKPVAPVTPAGPVKCDIDDTHSLALFRVHHLGASQFWGRFNDVSGMFSFTPGSAEGMKFDITIKTASVDTGTDALDKHLQSPDFFAAKDFPEMKFVSTGATKTGENTFDLSGNLTIRGSTHPVTAKLEFTGMASMGAGQRAGFEATFTIKRGEFGVNYGVEKGAVGNDVRVVVCLEGVVEGTAPARR